MTDMDDSTIATLPIHVDGEPPVGDPVVIPDTDLEVGVAGVILPDSVAAAAARLDDVTDDDVRVRAERLVDLLAARLDNEVGVDVDGVFGRAASRPPLMRSYRVDTIGEFQIRADGDGRTVEAYAVPWDEPAEVVDVEGHYMEVFRRGAFGRQLSLTGVRGVSVFYNHGLDMYARPSDRFAVPIGAPLEIREDGRGLFTATRYARTALGDEILQLVRDGAIAAQSIQFTRTPAGRGTRRTRRGHESGLDLVERTSVRLIEYGPTPAPVYAGASVVGFRAHQIAQQIATFDDTERERLAQILRGSPDSPPHVGGDDDDPPTVSAHAAERNRIELEHERVRRIHAYHTRKP